MAAELYNQGRPRKRVTAKNVRDCVVSVQQYGLPADGVARSLRITEEVVGDLIKKHDTVLKLQQHRGDK